MHGNAHLPGQQHACTNATSLTPNTLPDPIPRPSHVFQVRLASVAENSFNAVERIDEIAHIDQEDRDDIPGSRPDGWPSSGKVGNHTFQNSGCSWDRSLKAWLPGI